MRLTLFCEHSALVAHLEAEVLWLKAQMLHERQRAERAIDLVLSTRAQAPPVSPPALMPEDEARAAVRELLGTEDFSRVGLTDE